jgi:hemoglobin
MGDIRSRQDIALLVETFYRQVVADPLIGPFFTEYVDIDWDVHLPKMTEFWSLLIFGEGNYTGNTALTHVKLHQHHRMEKHHFERWLGLFNTITDSLFTGERANLAKDKAAYLSTIIQVKLHQADA